MFKNVWIPDPHPVEFQDYSENVPTGHYRKLVLK